MKVSKSSWHYRLNVSQNGSVKTESRNSLCAYFWYTVYSLIKVLRAWLVLYFLSWAIGFLTVSDTAYDPGKYWGLVAYPLATLIFTVLPGVLIFYLVRGASWVGSKIKPRLRKLIPSKKKKKKIKVKKQKGLVGSYLEARKEKICPLIEFEEE